jgi:hypothetical protein
MGAFSARLVVPPPPPLVPVPDRGTVSEGLLALLATVRLAEAALAAVGLKVTLTVQEPPAAIELPQVFVSAKLPVVAIDETDAAELVGLETVTLCAALVVPVACEPKFSAVGVTVTPEFGYGG